jgi:hypothetical protein
MLETSWTAMYAAMNEIFLFLFPWIVVIVKLLTPLLFWVVLVTFVAHIPMVYIAEPLTRCLWMYYWSNPMSLKTGDNTVHERKIYRKVGVSLTSYLGFFNLYLGWYVQKFVLQWSLSSILCLKCKTHYHRSQMSVAYFACIF